MNRVYAEAFTLIEMLCAVALFGLLAGLSLNILVTMSAAEHARSVGAADTPEFEAGWVRRLRQDLDAATYVQVKPDGGLHLEGFLGQNSIGQPTYEPAVVRYYSMEARKNDAHGGVIFREETALLSPTNQATHRRLLAFNVRHWSVEAWPPEDTDESTPPLDESERAHEIPGLQIRIGRHDREADQTIFLATTGARP